MLDIIDGWHRGECNGMELLLYKTMCKYICFGYYLCSVITAVHVRFHNFFLVSKIYILSWLKLQRKQGNICELYMSIWHEISQQNVNICLFVSCGWMLLRSSFRCPHRRAHATETSYVFVRSYFHCFSGENKFFFKHCKIWRLHIYIQLHFRGNNILFQLYSFDSFNYSLLTR